MTQEEKQKRIAALEAEIAELEYIILELLEALGYDRNGNLQDKNKLEGLTDFQINAINMALDQVHASVACSFVGFEQVMRTLRKRFYKK